MSKYRFRQSSRSTKNNGSYWLSFADLMSCLLLIIILVMFYIMYQYFDMYEISMAQIARQQFDLDAANATLEEEREKLSEAEQQMVAQQIRLNAAEAELQSAEDVLASQQEKLSEAESLLTEKELEIAAQQASLNALSEQLGLQQTQINTQQAQLNTQQSQLDSQQAKLDEQEAQIEELVGLKTRIITSLSDALKEANIAATVDPSDGSIALKADVLFATGEYDLTSAGKESIDAFLPIYLDVLFSDEYLPYVSEIIIEGHTDSLGGYITNLNLSMKRAGAVAQYVLGDNYREITYNQRMMLRDMVTANGRSYSDLVLDERGREIPSASRRVVFKFRLTDEQMIEQLKGILESNDAE